MAFLSATSVKWLAPTLRAVVNPAISVSFALATPLMASSGMETVSALGPASWALPVRCT